MTGIRQRVAVDFVDREPLGLVFREDLKGGFIEVIRVKSGGAAERMGVRVGWKVAVVDEKRMDHVKFDAVMRHLHNQRRPLRVCFERGELYSYFAGQINADAENDLCVVSFPGSAG